MNENIILCFKKKINGENKFIVNCNSKMVLEMGLRKKGNSFKNGRRLIIIFLGPV